MVAELIRLTLTLQANNLKRSAWVVVGFVIGLLYAFGALAFGFAMLMSLRNADSQLRESVLVIVGSALMIGWAVVPPLTSGTDQTLDPSRFTTLLVPQRQLVLGLLLSGMATPGGAATLILGLLWGLPTGGSGGQMLAGSLGGLLGALLCLVLARLVTTALAGLLRTRLFKDSAGIVLMLGLVLLAPIIGGGSILFSDETLRTRAGGFLAATPLGAPWMLGSDLREGHAALFWLHLLIAVIALLAAVCLWSVMLRREMTSGGGSSAGQRQRQSVSGAGMMLSLGRGPAGAIAARSLRYWLRDPRYTASIMLVPVFLAVSIYQITHEMEAMGVFYAGMLGFLLAWNLSVDVSLDSTAHWMHIASGVRGRDDRLGRLIAYSAVGLPALLLEAVVFGVTLKSIVWALAVFLFALGVWAISAGIGLLASSMFVQPTTRPHDSIFAMKSSNGAGTLIQLGGAAAVGILSIPATVMFFIGFTGAGPGIAVLGSAIGAALGAGALVVGVLVGGRQLEQRQPKLLEQLIAMDHS